MAKEIKLKPMNLKRMMVTIVGISPLIQHKWGKKAEEMMLAKKQGRKTKDREPCVPEKEFEEAMYRTADGQYGVPVTAVKSSIIGAAHKDTGIEKTLVRKSLFLLCDDPGNVLPMRCSEPVMRQDHVKVGVAQADLRFRPEFEKWEADVAIEYNAENLTEEDIVNLIDRAGFGVGICEWRPEKGGDYGRFQVKTK